MAGPYPPSQPAGGQPFPGPSGYGAQSYPYPSGYPGPLPPPVNYPPSAPTPPKGRRALWWALGALAVVAALVAGIVALSGSRSPSGSGAFTDAAAKNAIQNYLTALSGADTETVARNNACGMFDAIKDRKSDLALARLASDAFRKQFTRAEVTSIDEIVLSSSYQAQVLFTMKVAAGPGSRSSRDEQQGQAQLLRQDNQLLVCSYLLRTAAQY
jgi:hypothetical protein